jgi:RecA-family ATPase
MRLNKMERHPTTDIDAPYLGMGLEEEIQKWIDGVENPKLVVIDTLARVKAKTFSKGTAYDLDNELLRKLQQLAITNGVCIVLITHLSKASQDYNYDKITGSVGLQGMTDAMWLIDRGDNSPNASITGRGRDILDFEYAVKWHDETMQYEYVGDKVLVELNENREVIIKAMTELSKLHKGDKVRPKDVNDLLGFATTSKEGKNISRTMQRMANNLEITKSTTFGRYELNSSQDHNNF